MNCPRPKVRNPRTQKCVMPDSRALRFSGYYNGGVPLHEVLGDTVVDPDTGRRVKVGGYTYMKRGLGPRTVSKNNAAAARAADLADHVAFANAQMAGMHAAHQGARRNLEIARAEIQALKGRLAIDAAQLGALEEARVALEARIADMQAARRSAARPNAAARRNDAARAALQKTVDAQVRTIQNLERRAANALAERDAIRGLRNANAARASQKIQNAERRIATLLAALANARAPNAAAAAGRKNRAARKGNARRSARIALQVVAPAAQNGARPSARAQPAWKPVGKKKSPTAHRRRA